MTVLSAADRARAADLARMRTLATGLLVLMAVLFLAAGYGERLYPWLSWVRAFAEAGMVGACADWFAVTALFRQPLGLPIPHTGLIPRNKERIGDAFGTFIAENFLTEQVLDDRLRAFELSHWGGVYLADPAQTRRLAERAADFVPEMMNLLPPNMMREIAGTAAAAAVKSVPAAPVAARILDIAWSDGRSQSVLDWLVTQLNAFLTKHADIIHGRVETTTTKWMPKFVDRLISARIIAGLHEIVEEMRAPGHPWRQELHQAIQDLVVRLRTDPDFAEKAEAIKLQILEDETFQHQVQELWTNIADLINHADRDVLVGRIEQILATLGTWLQANSSLRDRLNASARAVVSRLIAPRRHYIGRFVAETVAGWDSRNIVDKLELQFGHDLQYIRINGTLVGGLVGLLIHALSVATGL